MLSMKPIYPKKIFVVGAGSIGTFLTARLKNHCSITLVTYDKKVNLFSNGIKIADGAKKKPQDYKTFPCIGWSSIQKFPKESLVILTTKIFHFPEVLPEILKRTDGSQTIALCQNGLGILEYVQSFVEKKYWDPAQWTRMACWFGSKIEYHEKPIVHVSGMKGVTLVQTKSTIKMLAQLFIKSGIPTRLLKDTLHLEWEKALANIFTNGICTITNTMNKMTLEDPFLFQIADRLLTEAMQVAKAEGVNFDKKNKQEVYQAIKIVGNNINSTLQDLRAGRPTEMPWLTGAVVSRAAKYGLQAPTNLIVYQLIQSLERQKTFTDPKC